MTVIVWIVEGTWRSCVDAARVHVPEGAEIVLLHVSDETLPGLAHGAYAGLLGRGRGGDPARLLTELAASSAAELLAAAANRLGRPCRQVARVGRPEREVVAAAEGAELLVLARDGDRGRPGPRSLAPPSRYVVDHAPCAVLLVRPEPAALPGTPQRGG